MAIEMGKKYRTRDGRDVRILCTDAPGDMPVVGLVDNNLCRWTEYGRFWISGNEHHMDLIEISPYSDIEIDAPGWARNNWIWQPRHFAGVGDTGRPLTWINGCTSHTTQGKTSCDEFTTTKPEGVT